MQRLIDRSLREARPQTITERTEETERIWPTLQGRAMRNLIRTWRKLWSEVVDLPLTAPAHGMPLERGEGSTPRNREEADSNARWEYRCNWDRVRGTLYMRTEADLNYVIWEQLPRGIRDKVTIDTISDAFKLHPKVRISYEVNPLNLGEINTVEAVLETELIEGMQIHCKLPEEFIARLCVLVP